MAEVGRVRGGSRTLLAALIHLLYDYLLHVILWILEKLLLTDVSLQRQLADLDQEAEELERAESQPARLPLLQVTDMRDKKLTINIKANTCANDEDDEYDPPSSADIEVVHKKALPKLHSILKQRTLSESSDDHGQSGGESPRSGPEDGSPTDGFKKSVSFNSHIDSATFKSHAAPTSMKTALKSKRRRARKKEEKKAAANGRRRKNSGSEGSSGEELSQTDSLSPPEDKEDAGNEERAETHFEQIDEKDEEAEISMEKSQANSESVDGNGSVQAEKDNQDFRTSVDVDVYECGAAKPNQVQDLKSKVVADADEVAADSDDDDDDELLGRTNNENSCEGVSVDEAASPQLVQKVEAGDSAVGEKNFIPASIVSGPGDLPQVIDSQDSSVITLREDEDKGDKQTDSGKTKAPLIEDQEAESEDKGDNSTKTNVSDIDSVLSWQEKGEGVDQFGNDHKTQCAFSFSNSVIYDLDVD